MNFGVNWGGATLMSNDSDSMLLDIVTKARDQLTSASAAADNTPRPHDACAAHDSQFALTKAISNALDTLLLISQQVLKNKAMTTGESVKQIQAVDSKFSAIVKILMKPWPWVFLSIAAFSPNFPAILTAASKWHLF